MKFVKMHGTGNDYVFIDAINTLPPSNPAEVSRIVSRRHKGIGSDGLILMLPSALGDCRMRIFNADGSEGMMCGNGARCIGKYLYERGYVQKKDISLETKSGMRYLSVNVESGKVVSVRVNMGEPTFVAERIPVVSSDPSALPFTMEDGTVLTFFCVALGNPHAVTFVDNIKTIPIEEWGDLVQTSPLFPEQVNVEFVQVVSRDTLLMRVFERGSGETLACGTGACATLVAAASKGLCNDSATVKLTGGDLYIEWDRKANRVYKTGSANIVFEGEWLEGLPE